MLFSSLEFLFLFLPVFFLLYFSAPRRWQNAILLVFSLLFYGWGEPVTVFLMILAVAANLWFGLLAARGRHGVLIAVIFDLAMLGFFKYGDFVISLFGGEPLGLPLPVGISFYTFQALSYVIDVSRGSAPLKNPVDFGAYISMFPQLIAGPIVRYDDISEELAVRHPTTVRAAGGIARFVCGLAKKVLLANPAGEMWDYFRNLPGDERGIFGTWLGLVFFAFQIYFDFSGYSDMALGLGDILGFTFPENFRYPYCAASAKDFWRRWHITLSTWFREYVYIPLGGNRHGTARTLLNLLIVWSLTGLWHGAAVNFLLWGLYWFFWLAAERLFLGRFLERLPSVLRRLYAIPVILLGWLIFAFDDAVAGLSYAAGLVHGTFLRGIDRYELYRNGVLLVFLILGSTPLPKRLYERYVKGRWFAEAGTVGAFLISVAYLVGSSYNPFLYFRF